MSNFNGLTSTTTIPAVIPISISLLSSMSSFSILKQPCNTSECLYTRINKDYWGKEGLNWWTIWPGFHDKKMPLRTWTQKKACDWLIYWKGRNNRHKEREEIGKDEHTVKPGWSRPPVGEKRINFYFQSAFT